MNLLLLLLIQSVDTHVKLPYKYWHTFFYLLLKEMVGAKHIVYLLHHTTLGLFAFVAFATTVLLL